MHAFRVLLALPLLLSTATGVADDDRSRLEGVKRTVQNEPDYRTVPKYCLLVFGPQADTSVWLVEDGDRLFVDQNANGDLTDDGEPVAARDDPVLRGKVEYRVPMFSPPQMSGDVRDLKVIRGQTDKGETHYSIHLVVNGVKQSGGWGRTFADSPGEAGLLHFAGALRPESYRQQSLRLFPPEQQFSIRFSTPGSGDCHPASLANDAVDDDTRPTAIIEWPSQTSSIVRTEHTLSQTLCYWEFADEIVAPEEATIGTATIYVTLPTDLPVIFDRHEFEMDVT